MLVRKALHYTGWSTLPEVQGATEEGVYELLRPYANLEHQGIPALNSLFRLAKVPVLLCRPRFRKVVNRDNLTIREEKWAVNHPSLKDWYTHSQGHFFPSPVETPLVHS